MSKFETVIFDLDGTLLNSLEALTYYANLTLKSNGFKTFNSNEYRKFAGYGTAELFKRALDDSIREDLLNKLVREYREAYEADVRKYQSLFDGVKELLDSLEKFDLKKAILSNKPHSLTLKTVDTFFKKWKFDVVFGHRDNREKKPNPESAIEIANILNTQSDRVLYIGDTKIDMQTAERAEFYSVGVTWGFRDEAELLEYGANSIVNHPLEILDILES